MAFNYQFPRLGSVDSVTVLNTPAAADYDLAKGTITIKDEAGADSLVVRACDLLAFDQVTVFTPQPSTTYHDDVGNELQSERASPIFDRCIGPVRQGVPA